MSISPPAPHPLCLSIILFRRPHMGDAPIIEQKAGFVPQTTDIPHVIDLDRYDESPAAACVALGISQPKLTKLIREPKVRSIKFGRTRLIEKAADVRRMATVVR